MKALPRTLRARTSTMSCMMRPGNETYRNRNMTCRAPMMRRIGWMPRYAPTFIALLFSAFAACSTGRARTPTSGSIEGAHNDIAELRGSVLATRAQLDSMVAQLNRISADPSASAVSRSIQLVNDIGKVDATYRSKLSDLLWAVKSSDLSRQRSPLGVPPSPLLQAFSDGEDFMLESPMVFIAGKTKPLIVIVPRGFVTDYASVPRPLRLLLPREGSYGNAAIVHDYLYWRQDCTREQSDNIMAIAMKAAGVSETTLRTIQIGVRLGGQGAWDTNRQDRQSGLIRTVGPPFDQVPLGETWDSYREWLHTHKANSGVEYPVPQRMCAIGDSDSM